VEDRYGAWQVHQLHRVETNLPRYFERCLLLSHIPAEQRAKIEQWLLSPGVPFLTLEEWIPGFEALFEYMEYDGYLHRDAEPRLGVGELHSRTG